MSWFTFSNTQIAATHGIACISPILRDYTYDNEGRPYFVITYLAGGVVEVPTHRVTSAFTDMPIADVQIARAAFLEAVGREVP